MTILILCWLLFALPLLMLASALFGAWVYAQGMQGKLPSISLPKFTIGRPKTNGAVQREDRLPAV